MTGTVRRIGGSLAVIIPKGMADGFSAGDKIEFTEKPDGILLRRQRRRPKRPIEDIVKEMDPDAYKNMNKDFLNDPPVGKEVW